MSAPRHGKHRDAELHILLQRSSPRFSYHNGAIKHRTEDSMYLFIVTGEQYFRFRCEERGDVKSMQYMKNARSSFYQCCICYAT